VSKWLGSGDYTVKTNSIVSKSSQGIPMMHSTNNSVVIRHKEFISTITGSTAFAVDQVQINPGLPGAFPWLSTIASSFQQYKFKGLVYHYIPTSGSAVSSTNPALGAVMMQTSYRSNDTEPASKAELLNEYYASESVPSETFCHPIECSPVENPFSIHYVRTTDLPVTDSPLMYDLGVLFTATQGMPAAGNVVGDLWASYEVELYKPIVASQVTSTFPSAYYCVDVITSGVSNLSCFGVPTTPAYHYGTLTCTYASGGVMHVLSALPGKYVLAISWIAASGGDFSTVDNTTVAPTLTNATPFEPFYGAYFVGSTLSSGTINRSNYITGFQVSNIVDVTVSFTNVNISSASGIDSANVSVYYLGA
jgi:hypothetical protein